MKRRKFLLGSSAALATGGLLTGTGAFSSAEVDRDVTIEVVGDRDAYLGLREEDMEEEELLFGGDLPRIEPETFDIINQSATEITEMKVRLLDERLEFMETASATGEHTTVTSPDKHSLTFENLHPGEKITDVKIRIPTAELNGVVRDRLLFEVDGPGLSIEAERTLELVPLVERVRFRGAGGVHFTTNAREPFKIVYWVAGQIQIDSNDEGSESDGDESDGNGTQDGSNGSPDDENSQGLPPGDILRYDRFEDHSFRPGQHLQGRRDGGPGYVAVYIPATDRSYYHPYYAPDTDRIERWGQGPRDAIVTDGKIL